MKMKVSKAVFPVAGLGTRFLPVTKANPKEMLPIVDKPLIQYAVEEAIAAGITELIFVTSSEKRAIEDHFDRNWELEHRLRETGKFELLELVNSILPKGVNCVYVRQTEQLGLGHAVLCAKPLINNEPFAVLLADDLMEQQTCLQEMITQFQTYHSSIIAVESVPAEKTDQYGIVELCDHDLTKPVQKIIEKPKPNVAPSNLGVVGRYILTPEIFDHLQNVATGVGNEIQLTDAIATLMQQQSVYAHQISGKRFDCGDKLGYLKATVEYGLRHPELKGKFTHFLKELTKEI
jgi:UTP--glucose-1-phosphate uridylyltransferase